MFAHLCGLALWILSSSTAHARVRVNTSGCAYELQWSHQGPNYSTDLFFPASGTYSGENVHETPAQFHGASTFCGDNLQRVACVAEHPSGGCHCETIDWSWP